jgi:predicted dehydrogenase
MNSTDVGMDRRNLLRTASRAGLAMTASSWSRVMGANDRIQLGHVGPGGRGKYVLQNFVKDPTVEVRAICDVWSNQIDEARRIAPNAKGYRDYRKMLESEKLDAVLVTTPDHWHAPIAIEALESGRDVYVEKPLTLTMDQGPLVVKAARVNNRICQVGTQARSSKSCQQLKREFFDNGKLGKITLIRTWYNGNVAHLRKAPESLRKQPDNLDWAKFLGPVKWRDWDPQQYWNWRAYLDFGGGQIGDLFVHMIDFVHMLMGHDDPVSAVASGGVLCYKDGRTGPDTISLALQYPNDYVVTFEATLAPGSQGSGLIFFGTEGRVQIDWAGRGQTLFYSTDSHAAPTEVIPKGADPTIDHVRNFLECMRSRKLPNTDVYIGHRSAQAAHLGKIAYLEKRRIGFDPVREEIFPL